MTRTSCLAVVLLATVLGRSPAAADNAPPDVPEPPPAPLMEPAEPEPAPAVVPVSPAPTPVPAPVVPAAHSGRASAGAAWSGAAVTLALITVGTVFGVLSQQRSDALSRSTASVGLPPIYDEAQRMAYTDLQRQGQAYGNATAGCFFASGATALASAVLFWNAARLKARDKSVAVLPSVLPQGGGLAVLGRF